MHEELWAAVEFKLENARFFLEQMSNDLSPAGDARTQISVAIQSTGAIMGNLWQKRFYAHLDAFLAMTRSTPDIIQSCFGADPRVSRKPLKDWFSKLDPMERKRRENFQSQFKKYYENFSKLSLSRARVATFHSAGTPPVEVKVTGRWGEVYIGSPLKLLPYVEMPHIIAGEDTSLQWAATQPSLPVEPTPDSFVLTTIDNPSKVVRKPLFPECKAYLQKAQELVEKARKIYQPVHHDKMLTPQPTN